DRIANTHKDQASSAGQRFSARGTGARMNISRAGGPQHGRQVGSREPHLLLPIVKLPRQFSTRGVLAQRIFTLGDTGSAGADHDAEAVSNEAPHGGATQRAKPASL